MLVQRKDVEATVRDEPESDSVSFAEGRVRHELAVISSNHPDGGESESLEHEEEPQVDITHPVARALIAGDRPEQVERPCDEHDEDPGEEERELRGGVDAAAHARDPDALAGICVCVPSRL